MTYAEMKFGPLESLVGRTFERQGARRTISRWHGSGCWYRRADGQLRGCSVTELLAWLSEAKEVTQ